MGRLMECRRCEKLRDEKMVSQDLGICLVGPCWDEVMNRPVLADCGHECAAILVEFCGDGREIGFPPVGCRMTLCPDCRERVTIDEYGGIVQGWFDPCCCVTLCRRLCPDSKRLIEPQQIKGEEAKR